MCNTFIQRSNRYKLEANVFAFLVLQLGFPKFDFYVVFFLVISKAQCLFNVRNWTLFNVCGFFSILFHWQRLTNSSDTWPLKSKGKWPEFHLGRVHSNTISQPITKMLVSELNYFAKKKTQKTRAKVFPFSFLPAHVANFFLYYLLHHFAFHSPVAWYFPSFMLETGLQFSRTSLLQLWYNSISRHPNIFYFFSSILLVENESAKWFATPFHGKNRMESIQSIFRVTAKKKITWTQPQNVNRKL